MIRRPFSILALLSLCTLGGCAAVGWGGDGGSFALRSEQQVGVQLSGKFTTAVYNYDDQNNVDVILLEGDEAAPTQAVHIRMFWNPRAGYTPVDPAATNATISYMVLTGDKAGVYGGAGFLFPKSKLGKDMFTANLRSSALRLLDATAGFEDKLGAASATGNFSARHDDAATLRLLRSVQAQVRQQLGYPAFVAAE